jgi:hypothetical protein
MCAGLCHLNLSARKGWAGAGWPLAAPGGNRGPGGQSRDPTQGCRVEVRHGRGGGDDLARSRLRLVYLGRCRGEREA